MDNREQQRKIKHRLAVLRHVEEVTGNVPGYHNRDQPARVLQVVQPLRPAWPTDTISVRVVDHFTDLVTSGERQRRDLEPRP